MENISYTFEKGKVEDSKRIYEVHTSAIKQLCSSHYGEKEILIWSGKQKEETYIPFLESGAILVAKSNGVVVAFIHHTGGHDEQGDANESGDLDNEFEIKGLFVDPSHSGHGLGRLLFNQVKTIALKQDARFIKVSASLNSLQFYSKLGFKEVERESHQITCQCAVDCVKMIWKNEEIFCG
ncbi:uncharacterized protein LOC114516000 [Dendronephthya gigantea]|uniref:uncharacterized protein LOC114516000 n=1 Tax=Dendronephthya gigantea TaxID=151771 RepID=UPI00106BC7D4|nr:uncharacterized protein LOC114516000 [Dendronephthya gigantea]